MREWHLLSIALIVAAALSFGLWRTQGDKEMVQLPLPTTKTVVLSSEDKP